MRLLSLFFGLILLADIAHAGPPILWNGQFVKLLKDDLRLNETARVLTGTDDPTSVAQDAEQGSIYLRTGAGGGELYVKLDAGSSTNWELAGNVVGPASSTDNAVVTFDGTSGKVTQNTGVTISDLDVLDGATQVNVDDIRLDSGTVSTTANNLVLDAFTNSIDFSSDALFNAGQLTVDSVDINASTITTTSGNLEVTSTGGFVTFGSAAVSQISDLFVENLQVNLNTVSSTSGDLIFDSFSNDIDFSGDNLTNGGDLTVTGTTTLATGLTGVAHLSSGVVSASDVDLATEVTGVLPVANGGTNSSTALNSNRVMISSGGAVVEQSALTANRALASDASGLPVVSATTDTELGYVNGVTSAIQTQLDAKLDDFSGSTDNALVRTDGATGDAIQEALITSADTTGALVNTAGDFIISDDVSGLTSLDVDNLTLDGNELYASTGDVNIGQTSNPDINIGGTSGTITLDGSQVESDSTFTVLDDGSLRVQEASGSGTDTIAFRAPTDTATYTMRLPPNSGDQGRVMVSSTSGASTNLTYQKISEVNLIADSSGNSWTDSNGEDADTTLQYTAYDDGASALPVDGTGGTASAVSCVRTTTSTEILNGTASLELAKSAADGQGEGCSIDFKIPIGFRNARLQIKTLLMTDDTNFDAGDVAVWLYNVDSAVFVDLEGTLNANDGKDLAAGITGNSFNIFNFTPSNVTDDDYRLIFHVTATDANAWDVGWDDISVGPAEVNSGVPVSDWTEYTLTIGATTTPPTPSASSTSKAFWKRTGDNMAITYSYANESDTTGAADGSGTYLFPIPSGYTINTNNFATLGSSGRAIVGTCACRSGGTNYEGYAAIQDSTQLYCIIGNDATAFTNVNSSTCNLDGNSVTRISMSIPNMPIAEWAGSANFGDPTVEFACSDSGTWTDDSVAGDTSRGGNNFAGCDVGGALSDNVNKVVEFINLQHGDDIQLQFSANDLDFAPHTNFGAVNSDYNTESPCSTTSTDDCGSGIVDIDYDANTVTVRFGRYRWVNDTTQQAWATGTSWRLKVAHDAPIGAELAGENRAGLVNPYTEGSGVVYGGTYTPTISDDGGATTATAISAKKTKYIRVANVFTVEGRYTATHSSASGAVLVTVSLPETISNFTDLDDCSGQISSNGSGGILDSIIVAKTSAQTAQIIYTSVTTSNASHMFKFSCEIL